MLGLNLVAGFAPTQQSATVTIIDARTNAPIADALVQLRQVNRDATVRQDDTDRAVQTDASGVARFADVPDGRYLLTVSTIGYIFVLLKPCVSHPPRSVRCPPMESEK